MDRYHSRKKFSLVERLLQVSTQMVAGYTTTIGKLIMGEPITDEWLNEVIKRESVFFSTIPGCLDQELETRKIWMLYTNSILGMMQGGSAVNCIIYGKLLGSWLDKMFT